MKLFLLKIKMLYEISPNIKNVYDAVLHLFSNLKENEEIEAKIGNVDLGVFSCGRSEQMFRSVISLFKQSQKCWEHMFVTRTVDRIYSTKNSKENDKITFKHLII